MIAFILKVLTVKMGGQIWTKETGLSAVFLKDGERKLCTPYMDTTGYGNLRFYFVMGRYILNEFCWPKAEPRPASTPVEVRFFVVYPRKMKFIKYEFYWMSQSAHTCFRPALLEPSFKRASTDMPW